MTEDPPAQVPPRRWRRRFGIALAVLVVLAAALRLALPYVLARAIEREAPKQLGLVVHVGSIGLSLLRGAVVVDGVTVSRAGDAGASAPLLRLGRLRADLALADLAKRRVRLSEIAVDAPTVRLARLADGSIENPVTLPPSEKPPAPEKKEGGAGWPLAIDALRVAGLDFELADAGRSAPAIGFALDELTLTDLALAGEDLTLGGVALRGPRLRVARDLVLARPAPGPTQTPVPTEAPPAAAPSAPPVSAAPDEGPAAVPPPAPEPAAGRTIRLDRVAIENAAVTLVTDGPPIDLEIDLRAESVGVRRGETFPFELAVRTGGGRVHTEGRAGLSPPVFDGKVQWQDLPMPLFVLAARPDLASWVRSCHADGELALRVRIQPGTGSEEAAEARASGHFTVRDLAIADPQEKEVALRWRSLDVGVRDLRIPLLAMPPTPIRVALEKVELDAPQVRFARPTPVLDALLGRQPVPAAAAAAAPGAADAPPPAPPVAEEAPPAPAAPEPAARPLELAIDSVKVTGGQVAYADGTLPTRFEAAIRDLSISAQQIQLPGPRALAVQVRGVAPERAPFSLQGDLDGTRGSLRFQVDHLRLATFDPYAAGAGYRVERGDASLRTALKLDAQQIASDNDLVLHDLRLGSADAGQFQEQFGTSLDFALAVLRDPSGDIHLPVPVRVERTNLKLGLKAIVFGALRAALVGVATSPLKAVGAALPRGTSGDIDLSQIAAAPGDAQPAPEQAGRVDALAGLLRARPMLAVSLTGRAGPEDEAALAERIAIERATAGSDLPEVAGEGFLARRRVASALRARGSGEPQELSPEDTDLVARTIAATPVPAERYAALARTRAEGLRTLLVEGRGVEPARVSLSAAPAEGAPGVVLELAAHAGDEAAPPGAPASPTDAGAAPPKAGATP